MTTRQQPFKMATVVRFLLLNLLICSIALNLEPLTPARANATITVTSTSDGTGGPDCTLRDAITATNNDVPTGGCPAGSGADTIILPANATFTFTTPDPLSDRFSAFPTITSDVTIIGNNAMIQRSTANGTPSFRFFMVLSTGKLTLRNLTLANGANAGNGPSAGIQNAGILNIEKVTFLNNITNDNQGAAIYNVANGQQTVLLNITDSIFDSNSTSTVGSAGKGGAIFNAAYSGGKAQTNINNTTFSNNKATLGAAIDNESYNAGSLASLTIKNTTFSNNIAPNGAGNSGSVGGAINNESIYDGATAQVKVINSTFYQNSAVSGGGAINNLTYNTSTAQLTVINSTFVRNTGAIGGAITVGSDTGTGTATALIQNSLFVNNNPGTTCASLNGTFLAGTNNLEYLDIGGAATCGTGSSSTATNPVSAVGLANNGGSTQTVALAAGSAAIDTGNNTICSDPTTVASRDQRGATRPAGPNCDIGAVEAGAIVCTATTVVTSNLDDGSCGTLRVVLSNASPGNTITFALSLPATINLNGSGLNLSANINLIGNCNTITKKPDITINGNSLTGPGLVLNGGNNLSGLKVIGFKSKQIEARANNHLKCVIASYIST